MSYSDLLKDVRWQKRRLEVLQKADWRCDFCGSDTGVLNVHHNKYRAGVAPWNYRDDELRVLCEGCHQSLHFKPGDTLAGLYIALERAHAEGDWDKMREIADAAMEMIEAGVKYDGLK